MSTDGHEVVARIRDAFADERPGDEHHVIEPGYDVDYPQHVVDQWRGQRWSQIDRAQLIGPRDAGAIALFLRWLAATVLERDGQDPMPLERAAAIAYWTAKSDRSPA